LSMTTPVTVRLARPKAMFYFYSPLQTIFSSPVISDTTGASTESMTRVTLKTYTLSIPSGANTVRVIVYGSTRSYYGSCGEVCVNIDGTDVECKSYIPDSPHPLMLIDYVGDISPGTRTVRVDGSTDEYCKLYIDKVIVVTGIGLTSTTPTDILSFSVTYQLLRSGDIRYSPGIRVFVWGNRKTTAPLTLTISEATDIIIGRNNLGAGNDIGEPETYIGEPETYKGKPETTILAILTGSIALQEGGEFTLNVSLRGNVGASGDVVIITRVLARAQLRRETETVGEVRIYERGVVEYFARALLVSVPGGVTDTSHFISRRDIQDRHISWVLISGVSVDITLTNYRIAVVTPVHFTSATDEDYLGETFLEWVQLVVWG